MKAQLHLALVLLFSPMMTLFLHLVLNRTLRLLKFKAQPQKSAAMAVFLSNIPVLALAWKVALHFWINDPANLVGGILYILVGYNSLGFVYFQCFQIGDTSLHMHTMLELLVSNGLSLKNLHQGYNTDTIIDIRLTRLLDMKQLRLENGRYYLNRRFLVYGSKIFDCWKIILGIPPVFEKEKTN